MRLYPDQYTFKWQTYFLVGGFRLDQEACRLITETLQPFRIWFIDGCLDVKTFSTNGTAELFTAHCLCGMFYSAVCVCVWGGGMSARRSNRFAPWLLSNSIFCQLASHTPTQKRTRRHGLHSIGRSITHAGPQAGSTHISTPTQLHTLPGNNDSLVVFIFFLSFHLAAIQSYHPGRFSDTFWKHLLT